MAKFLGLSNNMTEPEASSIVDKSAINGIEDQIKRAIRAKSSADTWITITCWLTAIVGIIAAPFTLGLSLIGILSVAPIAAVGCIATESKRQTELLKVIARSHNGSIHC